MMDIERTSDVDKITISKVDGAKADQLKKEICKICNERFFRNTDVGTLTCGQTYHVKCMDLSLSKFA